MKKKLLHSLGPVIVLLLLASAFWILHHELRQYQYSDIKQALAEIPRNRLLLSFALTILNYVVLTGYDVLALRYIRHPLAYGRIAVASFIGYALSHNIGLSIFTGSAVRYRFYAAWGLSTVQIAKVVAFCTLTLWLGILAIGGIVFLLEPMVIPTSLHLPLTSLQPVGIICLVLVGAYVSWGVLRKTPITVREWEFSVPSVPLSLCQIALSCVDWALAASVCYVLLPSSPSLSYLTLLSVFLLAQVAGIVSQVPGGLGVVETVLLLLLSPTLPATSVAGALVAYRAIYYLLPLSIATVLLAAHEVLQKKEEVRHAAASFGRWVPEVAPSVLAFTTFVGGAILLLSGATPTVSWRLAWLRHFLPLPVMELSHFLGSLVGIGLLFLAWGLQRRLDAAYLLSAALLSVGIILSLLKGFDYEEAVVLAVMLGALLPCRGHFYRQASLFSQRFTPGWIVAVTLVLLGSMWLGIFSYKHVEYSGELWWRFTFSDDAPRFLRATVGAIAVALSFALARLLRPALPAPALPSRADLEKARTIVERSRLPYAHLALLGDKAFLFSENGTAFIMYGIEGRSWVALGDPIGPDREMPELIWRYRELCERHDGWTVFYEVHANNLHVYIDLGLTLLKLGEEARVPLTTFSLEGGARRELRRAHSRLERAGCSFEVLPREEVPPVLPELKAISEAWLAEKNTREKRFSVGFFDEGYLQRFPAGIVRWEGKIMAFVNILLGADKHELSLDLMRYLPEAPHGIMEYLFIQLMLWGKREGYRWFSLGMAPLAGLEARPLAPLWNHLAGLVFRHGEHFYNFQGLRQFKEKFDPEWEPKYLASSSGLALPRILANIAALTSRGLKGTIAK